MKGSPSALRRNAAIAPRLTGSLGQYRLLEGGLHPMVIPASAIALMSASKMLVSSSTKWSVGLAGSPKARVRNAAIAPRLTRSSGQKRLLTGGLHPFVIPTSAMELMSPSNVEPLSSMK